MPNYNRVIMIGHCTRDIQLSYTPNQTAVANGGLACNRTWKDQNGQKKEEVCFVDFAAFGKTAEAISKFFKKGKPILIEGRLALDQWQDQQGNKRSKHKIVVESFAFVGGDQPQGNAPAGNDEQGPPPSNDEVPF